ncbi:MAG: hypothetical protein A2511_16050 [Deltaproteobacteria bacterium RIFOXYD12_FULL_50_9]|nr:MAG: hypothetical protein A2511_16050 [Deltaproteobacteria bacterium RIFOXYD12_FULL_50_9]
MTTTKQSTIFTGLVLAAALLAVNPGSVHAVTAPVAGTFAFDLYDIAVNDLVKGPVGFIGGVFGMIAAAVLLMRQQLLPAGATVLGSGLLLKADSVVASMGALIF